MSCNYGVRNVPAKEANEQRGDDDTNAAQRISKDVQENALEYLVLARTAVTVTVMRVVRIKRDGRVASMAVSVVIVVMRVSVTMVIVAMAVMVI